MKKLLMLIFVFVSLLSIKSYADTDIKLYINEEQITCDSPPMIIDGRTLVPARVVFENLDADVSWNEKTKKVKITSDTVDIVFTIGKKYAILNRKSVPMDVAPIIVNDRTYVPIRFVTENMGYRVSWDGETRSVYIDSSKPKYESEILSVEDTDKNGNTYVVIKLSNPVNPKISTYDNPYRIVLDFENTALTGQDASKTVDNIFISELRWASHEDYSRVVIEAYEKIPYDVTGQGTKNIRVKVGTSQKEEKPVETPDDTVTAPDENNPSEEDVAPELPLIKFNREDMIVVIDAGHGGVDVGAVALDENGEIITDENGNPLLAEKDLNLYIAQMTKKYLDKKNIKVLMTRSDDTFEGTNKENLLARAQLANDANACLFVSIHNNSATSPTANGTEVCYTSKSSGRYGISSEELARNILAPVVSATGLFDRGITDRPNLAVLKYTSMPAVLVECAFLSCETDRQILMDKSKLDDIAYAIAQGIETSIDQMLEK